MTLFLCKQRQLRGGVRAPPCSPPSSTRREPRGQARSQSLTLTAGGSALAETSIGGAARMCRCGMQRSSYRVRVHAKYVARMRVLAALAAPRQARLSLIRCMMRRHQPAAVRAHGGALPLAHDGATERVERSAVPLGLTQRPSVGAHSPESKVSTGVVAPNRGVSVAASVPAPLCDGVGLRLEGARHIGLVALRRLRKELVRAVHVRVVALPRQWSRGQAGGRPHFVSAVHSVSHRTHCMPRTPVHGVVIAVGRRARAPLTSQMHAGGFRSTNCRPNW